MAETAAKSLSVTGLRRPSEISERDFALDFATLAGLLWSRPLWENFVIVAPALFYRLAAVALIVAGLGLSGCGRKGPLDAPPGGLAANPDGSLETETATGGEVIRRGSTRGLPIIKGPNKTIPLDALLN